MSVSVFLTTVFELAVGFVSEEDSARVESNQKQHVDEYESAVYVFDDRLVGLI